MFIKDEYLWKQGEEVDWTEEEVKLQCRLKNALANMMGGGSETNTAWQSCPASDQNGWGLYPYFIQSLTEKGWLWMRKHLKELIAGGCLLTSIPTAGQSLPWREIWAIHLYMYHRWGKKRRLMARLNKYKWFYLLFIWNPNLNGCPVFYLVSLLRAKS